MNNLQKNSESNFQSSSHEKLWTKPFIALIIGVILLMILSLLTGAYDIFNQPDGLQMFFITRVPRTAALMLSSSAMAVAGLVMQMMTQNRFVEPTTTGTVEWAGLGLLVVYILIPGPTLLQRMAGAILFSFVGTMIFFALLQRIKLKSSLIVPIIGIMLGSVVSAFSTFMGLLFEMTQTIEIWFQGSFASVQVGRYEYLWFIVITTIIIYWFADKLTIISLGKDVSTNLGVNYNRVLLIGTALVSFSVGIVAAVIGNLPFLGLIVPNVVSMIRGDDLRSNLPWVALLGMATILSTDIIARIIIAPFEVPVSLILGTLGALVFAIILLRSRRRA
jgi:iron complex transport system permease protein